MKLVLLVALVACRGSDDKAAPTAAPKETHTAQLVACRPALPAPVDPRDPLTPRRAPARIASEWTPFAAQPIVASDAVARPVAEMVARSVRERLASVETCFDGALGAVRAMIAIDTRGAIAAIRTGGIGDSGIERCIATALAGFTVAALAESVEIACDFARGRPDAPLRVTPDAGYTVVEVNAKEVRTASGVHVIPPKNFTHGITALGVKTAVLVIADPDAPGRGIDFALWWAPPGTTLVAVKASGGAPVFVGMGDSRADRAPKTDKRVLQLRTNLGTAHACVPGSELRGTAPLVDFRVMDAMMIEARKACEAQACDPTIVVGTTGDFTAKELVATTSAARRAGFERISIGGPACD